MEKPETLGAFLRAKRKELGLTLQEVGTLCKTSKSYIWELEHDRSRPGLDMALILADALAFSLICYWDYQQEPKVSVDRRKGERRRADPGRRFDLSPVLLLVKERRRPPVVGYVGRRYPCSNRRKS